MDIKTLKAFQSVYEYRNITQAAKSLYISAQGLSSAMKKLESELGVVLFNRRANGIAPTVAADRLYQKTAHLIVELEHISRESLCLPKDEILLGCTCGIPRLLSVKFLLDFHEKYPDILLRITEDTDTALSQQLRSEQVTLAILTGPIDPFRFHATFFSTTRLCLLVNVQNPLAQRSEVSLADLDGQPLLISSRAFNSYSSRLTSFARASSAPIIYMETLEMANHVNAAIANYAVALCVKHPCFIGNHPEIKAIPFIEKEFTWDTYLVYQHGQELTENELLVHQFALDWVRANRPELQNGLNKY